MTVKPKDGAKVQPTQRTFVRVPFCPLNGGRACNSEIDYRRCHETCSTALMVSAMIADMQTAYVRNQKPNQ